MKFCINYMHFYQYMTVPSDHSVKFAYVPIKFHLVFPFPDVYFYSREYGNGSSHSRDSRAPGNDVNYEGLMTKKIY